MRIGFKCIDLMKLFTFMAALLPLSLMAQIGTGPSVRMTNSSATGLSLQGTSTFKASGATGTIKVGPFNAGGAGFANDFDQLEIHGAGLGISLQNSNRVPYMTFGNNNSISGAGALETIGRMYLYNAAPIKLGDPLAGGAANIQIPKIAGSLGSASDLPVEHNAVKTAQLKPWVVMTSRGNIGNNNQDNCTEAFAKETIASFRTNGLLQFTTNTIGKKIVYELCDGWLTNRRHSVTLSLQWDTNRWPSATVNPSNVANIFLTNDIEGGLMMYNGSEIPTNGNTQILLDYPSGIGQWQYPNGVDPNPPGAELQPLMDGGKIHQDISTFYSWNFWWFSAQDTINAHLHGWQQDVIHSVSYAIQYPYLLTQAREDRPYKSWYQNAPHPIIYNQLLATVTLRDIWPLAYQSQVNSLFFGTGAHSDEPAGSGVLGFTVGCIRPEIGFYTNLMSGGGFHPIFQSDPLAFMDTWDYVDWKNHMALVAMFNANLWLTSPHARYFTNSAFGLNYTNLLNNGIWQDDYQGSVICVSLNATNFVFAKKLARPNQFAVLFGNMSRTMQTNLTIPFKALGYTNVTAFVRSAWTNNAFINISSNSYTTTVDLTNHQWITLEFSAGDLLVNSLSVGTLSNAMGQILSTLTIGNGVGTFDYARTNFSLNGSGQSGSGQPGHLLTFNNNDSEGLTTLSFKTYYDMGRNNSDGLLTIAGSQVGANGLRLTGDGTNMFQVRSHEMRVSPRANFTNGISALAASSIPTNTAAFTIITTDFALNTFYTNTAQRAYVQATVGLLSGVGGNAQVALYIDQDQNGSFERTGISEALVGIAASATNSLGAFIQPLGRFVLTNLSSGGGVANIQANSSEWVKQ